MSAHTKKQRFNYTFDSSSSAITASGLGSDRSESQTQPVNTVPGEVNFCVTERFPTVSSGNKQEAHKHTGKQSWAPR